MSTGRRARKKAATRQAIADAALALFTEHGFDAVSISDIAEAADVARTTLFAHFPSKEALVFDRDTDQRDLLLDAVRGREPGTSIPDALRGEFHATLLTAQAQDGIAAFHRLIDATPALRAYEERMWHRHEAALAAVIAADLGVDVDHSPVCRALARFALDVYPLARTAPDPAAVIDDVFTLLRDGWAAASAHPR